jgi:hypothetical protein
VFGNILRSHLTRYPDMQIQDVYKLIHQSTLGSEHAGTDPEAARKWIERELVEVGEEPVEPVVDPISPDGEIVRVHMRPYVLSGGSVETLFSAFIRTANEYPGDRVLLKKYWDIAAPMSGFPITDMENFIQTMDSKGYPAVHHSLEYKNAYRPAYRVISRKYSPWLNSWTGD